MIALAALLDQRPIDERIRLGDLGDRHADDRVAIELISSYQIAPTRRPLRTARRMRSATSVLMSSACDISAPPQFNRPLVLLGT